jgi:hypothetical protein
MKWTIKLEFEAVTGSPVEHELGIIERAEEISAASVGLTRAEGKGLLAGLQEQVVTAQVQQHVATIKSCPAMRQSLSHEAALQAHSTFCLRQRLHANPTRESMPLLGIAGAKPLGTVHEQEPLTPELRYLTA